MIVFQVVLMYEFLNLRILIPLLAVDLIAANMEVFVGEQLRHLTQKRFDKLVNLFARRIKGRILDSKGSFNLIRPGCAG